MEPNPTIADQNTERLIQNAYQPEPVSPAFAAALEAKLQTQAKQMMTTSPASRSRWAALILAGIAASGLIVWAIVAGWQPRGNDKKPNIGPPPAPLEFDGPFQFAESRWTDDVRESMQPRRRPAAPNLTTLKVGQKLTTLAGKRQLVQLADGTRLYANEKTEVEAVADRQLVVHKGQIYLEVAPKDDADKFLVKAGTREFVATGTHFAVQADNAAAGLVVTQGKVSVKGVDPEVRAGQAIEPGQSKVTTAPRASHALEWTRELMAAAESPMVPSCQHQGGALLAIDPNGQEIKLELRKYAIDVHIEDGFARTTIDQTYFNTTWERLEGTFYFPLPADASLSRLAMYVVDGNECKLMEGGMAERKHAADVYETIRYQRRDPALLEWLDGTTFKMRVFPLEAKQEKRIILSYTQKLPTLYGTTRYRFPGGHSLPAVREWFFTARIKSGAGMTIWSPTHEDLVQVPEFGDVRVHLYAKNTAPKSDVWLEMKDKDAAVHQDVPRFASFHHENHQYLMLRYRPNLPSMPERKRRDWIVLFESSAQRDPLLAGTQVDIVRNVLKNAEYDDTFTLLTVNSKVNAFQDKTLPARPKNVDEAIKFLNQTHLVGALDLQQGLEAALKLAKDAKNPHILHIGSGVPAMGERDAGELAKMLPESVPYVGVGVGKRWNRAFMKAAAERTNGLFTQINPDETIAWRAFELLATLNTPRLLDVQLLDPNGKTRFLLETTMLAQGEELCAVTRVDTNQTAVPGRVILKGTLDGKPITREFLVMNVLTGAGYLPRMWAKQEIDRMLADGAMAHKNEIIALSKAMYVMSPFTSLLVLETDADYERFKVDKGRKDHWAMYQTDKKIPLVYEPGNEAPKKDEPKKKKSEKPSVEEVLKTIAGSSPYRDVLVKVNEARTGNLMLGAGDSLQLFDFDAPDDGLGMVDQRFLLRLGDGTVRSTNGPMLLNREGLDFESFRENGRLRLENDNFRGMRFDAGGLTASRKLREKAAAKAGKMPPSLKQEGKAEQRRLELFRDLTLDHGINEFRGDTSWHLNVERARPMLAGLDQLLAEPSKHDPVHFAPVFVAPQLTWGLSPGSDGPALKANLKGVSENWGRLPDGGKVHHGGLVQHSLPQLMPREREAIASYFAKLGKGGDPKAPALDFAFPVAGGGGMPVGGGSMPSGGFGFGGQRGTVAGIPPAGTMTSDLNLAMRNSTFNFTHAQPAGTTFRYERPTLEYNHAHFSNLLQYAPGLSGSMADVLAILEAEAEIAPVKLGTIDPAARKLIDATRSAGWTALTIPADGPLPSFPVYFNGNGQFAYEHLLISGLTERVICDGKTLWHLYPEIGLASKRPFSRHHQHMAAALNPALVPAAEELARGGDVKAIDASTVAIIPTWIGELKKDDKYGVVHLVFAKDGSLSERRIVEMPSGKVLLKQIFTPDGAIEWKDAEDKSLTKRTRTIAAAQAPSLTPTTDDLVVINLPLRTREHVNAEAGKAGLDADVDIKTLSERFVTDCLTGQPNRDQGLTMSRLFENVKNRKPGYFVLLNAVRGTFLDQPLQASNKDWYTIKLDEDHPQSPLAAFVLQGQRELRQNDQRLLKKLPGPKNDFIHKLSTCRDIWLTWQTQRPLLNGGKDMPLEKAKAMEFLQETTSPVFAYAILDVMQRRCNTAPPAQMLALVEKRFGPVSDPLGLGYLFRYEHARSLYHAGIGGEASKRFRELHAEAIKYGVLPPIDPVFRDSLQMPIGDGPRFIGFTRKTLDELLGQKRYGLAFQLAKQMEQLGDEALSDEILTTILDKASKEERNALTLVSVQFLTQRKNFAQADRLLSKVLADEKLALHPELWRWRADLTKQAGQTATSIACLEKALDLEYAELPEIVNLESIRTDYRTLLTHYQKIAEASSSLEKSATKAFLAKVIRTADRWRLVDPEASEPCTLAGKTLFLMGERDLAWDYWTTPIDLHPAESAPWLTLADTMRNEGDLEKADRAFALAFEAEQTNPEILWRRAQNAVRMGQPDAARRLYRQIADGQWQERFQATVEQARGLAGQ